MQSRDKFNEKAACFITLQTVDSVDIFVRPVYKQVIVHTLNHFIESKGLIVYAWCLMTHHLHLLVAGNCKSVEDLENEYKLFTTKKILEAIETEPEDRKEWMLKRFECPGSILGFMKKYHIWQETANPSYVDLDRDDLLLEKFDFIHQNPVRDRIVDASSEYLYSSARDYTSSRGLVNITKLPAIELQLAAAETMSGNFFVKYIRN
jgi:REP element-mobilizing transposase RayT